MLIQFNVKNYLSFRDEVSLSLEATKMTEHHSHIVEISNDKVLKVAVIYGANASGKSNLYDAYRFMERYVIESFGFGGEDIDAKSNKSLKATPFLFDKTSQESETTFEVFFTDQSDLKQKMFQYGFALKHSEVIEEWLFQKSKSAKEYKTIFYRKKGEELDFSGLPKKSAENLRLSLEPETLIVSLGAKLKIEILKFVRDWFLKNEIVDFGNPAETYVRSRMIPKGFVDDNNVQKRVVNYLSSFDESIEGFKVEEHDQEDENKEKVYKIETEHKVIGSEELINIPLNNESAGTLKMFALYPNIEKVINKGGVLFIDELNSKLHPLLVRNIVLTFLDSEINKNNAQLIFTTHDTWQLTNDLFRRDEIWFVEKNNNGVSTLYSLADFKDDSGEKIRKDESYIKNYLYGKYGAIPKLKSLGSFQED